MICSLMIAARFPNVFINSGHQLDQLGQYHDCIESSKMNYNVIRIADNQTYAPIGFMGFCLPDSCNKNIINNTLTNLLDKIHIPFAISEIQTHQDIQSYSYGYNWVFWLTLFYLIFLVLISFISTFISSNQTKYMECFNIKTNLKLFDYQQKKKLNVINGIKALSMIWVVFGHSHFQNFATGVSNILNYKAQATQPINLFTYAGFFAVDIFFFLGGFLVAYSILRQKMTSKIDYMLALLHRVLRFWPCLLTAILVYYAILMNLSHGPIWQFQQDSSKVCENLWRPLLFIDNLYDDPSSMCLNWAWYLEIDMQLFVLCLIILFIYRKYQRIGLSIAWILLIITTLIGVYVYQYKQYKVPADVYQYIPPDFFSYYYIKPWNRAPPYLYGLLLGIGYVKFLTKNSKQMNKKEYCFLQKLKIWFCKNRIFRIAFELIGVLLFFFIILIVRMIQVGNLWTQIWHSLYMNVGRLVLVVGVSMMMLPSILGLNSFIQYFLDNKVFSYIAKISFCTYLFHLMFIFWQINSKTRDFYYTAGNVAALFFSYLICSMTIGFIMTMLVQIPFSKLEKMLLKKLINFKKVQKQQIGIIHNLQNN